MFLTIKTCYFTQRRVTKVKFPDAFYLPAGLFMAFNFLMAPVQGPAPEFFPSGSGSGSKEPKTPGSGSDSGSPALVFSLIARSHEPRNE